MWLSQKTSEKRFKNTEFVEKFYVVIFMEILQKLCVPRFSKILAETRPKLCKYKILTNKNFCDFLEKKNIKPNSLFSENGWSRKVFGNFKAPSRG